MESLLKLEKSSQVFDNSAIPLVYLLLGSYSYTAISWMMIHVIKITRLNWRIKMGYKNTDFITAEWISVTYITPFRSILGCELIDPTDKQRMDFLLLVPRNDSTLKEMNVGSKI